MPSTYQITELQSHAALLSEAAMLAEDDDERERRLLEMDALLDELGDKPADKLDGIRAVCLRMASLEDECRKEAARLSERARTLKSHHDRVKRLGFALLDGHRRLYGEAKIQTATANYRLQMASKPSVTAPCDAAYAEHGWTRTKVTPDKTAALKALLEMDELPAGWTLERSESIRW